MKHSERQKRTEKKGRRREGKGREEKGSLFREEKRKSHEAIMTGASTTAAARGRHSDSCVVNQFECVVNVHAYSLQISIAGLHLSCYMFARIVQMGAGGPC